MKLNNKLPNDISRCGNDKCELRKQCQRWLQRYTGNEWQTFTIFKPKNNKCENQIKQ